MTPSPPHPDTAHLSEVGFDSLDLPDEIQRGIRDAGFTLCTPIQALTLPPALSGEGVAGQAQTGTGKTAAYLVTVYNKLLRSRPVQLTGRDANRAAPRALIIAPTRELVAQIHADAETLGAHTGLRLTVVYGGVDYDKQRRAVADGCDILVGTPGRLIDYFKQGIYTLLGIQVAVLDEADRMFDLGFIKDIRYLLRRMPSFDKRQSMLFSATLDPRVMELAYEHMDIREMLAVPAERLTAEKVRQQLYHVATSEKFDLLLGVLAHEDPGRTLVFVNTRREATRLEERLRRCGYAARALTGEVPQRKRMSYLRQFMEGNLALLIATDVASRGLHIPDVSHVINYDLPDDKEDYVHRVGRTARAGAEGDAISFCCDRYALNLVAIEEYLGHSVPSAIPMPELFADEHAVRRAARVPMPDTEPAAHTDGAGESTANKPRARQRRGKGDRGEQAPVGNDRPTVSSAPKVEGTPGPKRRRRRRRGRRGGDGGTAADRPASEQ
ncbi:MAG: DEAD/DEAH box helicase [Nitrospirota bacterium]|jgi:ATP-dependent RNA helicase RhlB